MDIDTLVSRLESELMPKLHRMAEFLRVGPNFDEVTAASIRHADILHAIGIRCRPKWGGGARDDLTFTAAVVQSAPNDLGVRLKLGWGGSNSLNQPLGYLKEECRSQRQVITSDADLRTLVQSWDRMLVRFKKVAMRGRPSPRWLRAIRGAPRDLVLPTPRTPTRDAAAKTTD